MPVNTLCGGANFSFTLITNFTLKMISVIKQWFYYCVIIFLKICMTKYHCGIELLLKNNIKGGSFPLKCLVMVMNLDFSQHQLLFWTFRTNCLKKDLFTFQSIFLWAIKIFIQWSKSVTRILQSKKYNVESGSEVNFIKMIRLFTTLVYG